MATCIRYLTYTFRYLVVTSDFQPVAVGGSTEAGETTYQPRYVQQTRAKIHCSLVSAGQRPVRTMARY
jgi:hypothetical protein